jgi:pimeloyl-ACP methyl ester carboxylesterase
MSRPRVLLLHGSVANGEATWAAQRPLAERFDLVVPNRRGFPPGPDVERVDYEDEAVWLEQLLEPGTHLVGHSYGGVIALLAAARRPELLASLTVIEPPAFAVARGHASAERFVADAERLWEQGPREPETFLRAFMQAVGGSLPAGRPQEGLLQGARTLMVERYPWTAQIPLDELARTPFPKLVVSGAHSEAFDAVCDVLERRLGAERAVLPGAGHSV